MAKSQRPLSPHLQIYKTQITMVMSILHRITGVGLYFGFVLLAWWLVASAMGGEALNLVNQVMGHWLSKLILIGFTWALFNHMLGGIRHFIWDSGRGFSKSARFGFAWATLFGGLILTVLVWAFILWS
jgi:succinate dehydrogenase / fumarate reductase cytochrome b subunit